MNTINKAQANAYGRYLSANVLRDGPSVNLRSSESNRGANTLTSHARHAIPTIWDNHDPNMRDIALYDPRNVSSIMNYEQTGDNSMLIKLQHNNKPKIETIGDDLLPNYAPKISLSPNSLDAISENNKSPYFPRLPISANNQFPKDVKPRLGNWTSTAPNVVKPTLIDERMLQHTTDRDFAWDDDKQRAALNLLKNPRRWQRQERIDDDTRRLEHMGQPVDRWNENKNAYIDRPSVTKEYIVDMISKRLDEASKYNSLDDASTLQHIEKTALNPIYSYHQAGEGVRDLNHRQSANADIVLSRYVNDYGYDVKKESFEEPKKSIFETITNTVLKLFKHEPAEKPTNKLPIPSTYEIEPITTTTSASTFISPVSRMMCFEADGQLHVIQKMDSERLFASDSRPVGDDLILTVLPKKYTDKIRDKMHKSEGRQFKEMSLEDFEQMLLFITKNPQVQKRVKAEFVSSLLTDRVDLEMLNEFAGDKVIIENSVLNGSPIDVDERRTWSLLNRNSKRIDIDDDYNDEQLEYYECADRPELRTLPLNHERMQTRINSSELELDMPINEQKQQKHNIKQRSTRQVESFARFRSE